MPKPSQAAVVKALLDRHGTSYATEAGFTVRHKPASLFRLLCLSLLLSARISADHAVAAAAALAEAGWTTPDKLAASTWRQRVTVLNRSGYARYDESTARMLGDSVELLCDRWRGDLRRLRDEAGREPAAERDLLKGFTGIGDVGVDIFFREVQGAWSELAPFVDAKAAASARKLGLNDDPAYLARLAGDDDLSRLAAALVRCDLARDHDEARAAAGG